MDGLITNITASCPLPFSGTTGQLFARAVAAVVASHCAIFDDSSWPKDNAPEILSSGPQSFDFIVVGAGTAGSVVAGNLMNHNPQWSVLLVEAGDDPSLSSEVPALIFFNENIDWKYETNSPGACLGMKNDQCIWSKGKAMGGSSSINAMLYTRGHPKDYDLWEDLGNQGWGYENLEHYFNKVEDNLNLSSYKYNKNKMYYFLEQSYKEAGIPATENDTNEAFVGTKIMKLLTRDGKRLNTAKLYLKESENLYVMKNTVVQKVIVDSSNNKATGVEVRHKSGIVIQISVKKEVILSAGSVATPQILMLSGIGPKLHLNEIGIKCLKDLSVGKNLQDHVIFPLILTTNQHTQLPSENMLLLLIQYMLTKTGPLSNIGITDFMSFINTKNVTDVPDIQFLHFYFNKNDRFMLHSYLGGYGFQNEIMEKIENLNSKSDLLCFYPTLLHAKSRGQILLFDSNVGTNPNILTNYFQHKDDIKTMLRAIDFVQNLEKTELFKSLRMKLVSLSLTGCAEFPEFTEDYWECYIRHMASTIYHPVGTAKMGRRDDDSAVVDYNLLVHGMKNLRVVDASIMPSIPGGNTMATTLAIAEKASDFIINTYSLRDEL